MKPLKITCAYLILSVALSGVCSLWAYSRVASAPLGEAITANPGPSDDGDDDDDDDDVARSPIRLRNTSSPSLIDAGEEVTYEYIVKAVIPVFSLVDVSVTDDRCSPISPLNDGQFNSGDHDQDNVLDGDEAWRFTCATLIYVDTVNLATATATVDRLGIRAEATDEAEVDVRPSIQVNMSADQASVPERGGDVTFTIVVTNLTDEEATLEALNDSVYGNLDNQGTCDLPQNLSMNGETYACSYTKFIDAHRGEHIYRSRVVATASDNENNEVTTQDNTSIEIVNPAAQLTAAKRDSWIDDHNSDNVANPGDVLEYRIIITNEGDDEVRNIRLEDRPDDNTLLIAGSVTTSRGSVTKGNRSGNKTVIVNIGDLPAGQNVEITFQVTIAQSLPNGVTRVENQARVRSEDALPIVSDDPDTPAQDDATATLVAATPALMAFKHDLLMIDADNDNAPSAGDTVRYKIVVANTGNQSAVGVVVRDTPDNHTALVTGSVNTNRGTVVMGNSAGDTTVEIALSDLALDDEATIRFEVMIANPLPDGVARISNQAQITGANTVTVLSDDPATPAPGDPTQTTVAVTPMIEMTKRDLLYIDADGDDAVSVGDTLIYVIRLSNVGNDLATDVLLRDTPDPRAALQSGSVQTSQGIAVVGNAGGDTEVAIELGSLAPGTTANVGFRVYVVDSGPGTVSNQAVVQFGSPNGAIQAPAIVVSDDPDTPAGDDPTVTPVIPSVSGTGGNLLYLPVVDK